MFVLKKKKKIVKEANIRLQKHLKEKHPSLYTQQIYIQTKLHYPLLRDRRATEDESFQQIFSTVFL